VLTGSRQSKIRRAPSQIPQSSRSAALVSPSEPEIADEERADRGDLALELGESERCGGGDRVDRGARERSREEALRQREDPSRLDRRRPGGDRGGKGGLEKGAPDQRGIEEVLPQTSPDQLTEADPGDAAHEGHPERHRRRERESKHPVVRAL
jgi:hypothetical protein